ncbi:MAG: hypothetical protein BWY92_01525 [Firmicutes bacterium ADurb.BinA052]|nr:MAG: hypothetical protein BWY92_01525 [Firmicutes bacterium ADurb.BinA052]
MSAAAACGTSRALYVLISEGVEPLRELHVMRASSITGSNTLVSANRERIAFALASIGSGARLFLADIASWLISAISASALAILASLSCLRVTRSSGLKTRM